MASAARPQRLKQSVEARDRLALLAETTSLALHQQMTVALEDGDLAAAETAVRRSEQRLAELAENLRIYQAELHAQADELAQSQARSDQLLARFSALFAHMPVAAMLVGANGEVLEFNALADAQLGLRKRSAAARFMHRLVDPLQYQSLVRPAFHEARAGGASGVADVRMLGDGQRPFIGEVHIAWLPGVTAPGADPAAVDAAAAAGLYACAVIDRSEHIEDLRALQASEAALRQSESFLADTARLARIGGWELTLRPRAWRWSPQLREVFDFPPELPASLDALLDGCAPPQRLQLLTALDAAERGTPFELELDMHGGSGRPLRVLAVGHAERAPAGPDGEPGEVLRVLGVLQDISGPALARRQIGDLTERLRVANEAGGIGVWDWDLQRDEVVLDARMARLLELAEGTTVLPAPALRSALGAMLPAAEAQRLDALLMQAVQDLGAVSTELRRNPPDASGGAPERWLHLTGRAHAGTDGRALRLVGCAWDCSVEHEAARLLAAKDSAEQASQSKSAFLSRMSHELRTPLNAILGFSQLMRMEAEAGDLVLKPHRVSLIETAARHLLDLVNEVLDVSRIESGQLEVKLEPFELADIVGECLPMVQGLADRAGVDLRNATGADAPCTVVADRLRLKEVLINLLSNAIKYNKRGGHVEVHVRAAAEGCVLEVADTGQGLTPAQQTGLFQPFNRLGAEATGIEGSGMGLFVSRRFVELMGGRIEVASTLGEGTTVRVCLNVPA